MPTPQPKKRKAGAKPRRRKLDNWERRSRQIDRELVKTVELTNIVFKFSRCLRNGTDPDPELARALASVKLGKSDFAFLESLKKRGRS
jgi:hypothetical protein